MKKATGKIDHPPIIQESVERQKHSDYIILGEGQPRVKNQSPPTYGTYTPTHPIYEREDEKKLRENLENMMIMSYMNDDF